MTKSKKPKDVKPRNPVAKNLKENKPKVIPNKKRVVKTSGKDAFSKVDMPKKGKIAPSFDKAKKPRGGQMNATYDGM